MRIKIDSKISIPFDKLIKRCGYAEIKNKKTGTTSYVRRLYGYHYPRFHIYIVSESQNSDTADRRGKKTRIDAENFNVSQCKIDADQRDRAERNEAYLSLHLDQKAPIYEGVPAHSADYQGKVLEKEAERIKQFIEKYKV